MDVPAPPVHLQWVAPAECPSRDDEAVAIARTVGVTALTSAVEARVVVTRAASGFRADVSVSASGATSTRALEDASCLAVADAAALIIALAANPDAGPREPPAAGLAPVARIERPDPPRSRVPRLPYSVGASFLVDAASLPSASYGGELELGWSPSRVELEVVGAFLGQQSARLSSMPSQGATLSLLHLGGRACYALLGASFDVAPCLGGGVEWVTARGFGSAPDEPESAGSEEGVASLGARASLRVFDRLTLRVLAEGLLAFERPPFVIDGGGTVFQAPPVSFRAMLGAEAHF